MKLSNEALAVTGMILQLADGTIQACNAGVEQLLGLRSDQIQSDIFQHHGWQTVQENGVITPCQTHPATIALQTGESCSGVEMGFIQPSGNLVQLRVNAEPLLPASSPQTGNSDDPSAQKVPYAVVTTLLPANFSLPGEDSAACKTTDRPAISRSPSEQLFATLESISDAFFSLDQNWRFTYVNSQAYRVLNRSTGDLMGKSHWEEFPDTVGTIVEQEYRRAIAEQTTVSFEIFYLPLNGWFSVRAYPIYIDGSTDRDELGLAVYFQNITEQKLAQSAFLQQEQTAQQRLAEIEAIYATAPVGLCFNDTDLRFVRINQQLAEINGASVEQHIGHTLRELLPELADQLEPIYRRVIETGEPILNLEVSGKNPAQPGVVRTWLSSYYPLKDQRDRILGVNVVVQEITEHKRREAERQQAELNLLRSEERYRTLFESIDEGFCIIQLLFDEHNTPIDYRFLETNPTFEAQTGLEQAVGKTIRELIPDIESHWIEIYGKIALTGEAARFESASEVMGRWFDVYAFRVDQPESRRVALLFKDISDRKRSEAALQESETRFRRMTDILPQIMWTADPDGTIDYYNQQWEDFTGTSRVGTSEWEWRQILHPDDVLPTIAHWTQSIRTGALYDFEHRVRRKDGEYRWHLTRAVPYRNEQGQIIKWFGMAIDIHDQKLAMAERERYAEQVQRILRREQAARTEAENANRVKDEFLAVLSHELRSPLNPILGWTKLLQTGRLDAQKTADALATIERNAKLQTQLIEDLLDISRVMRGKLTLIRQPTNLLSVISSAVDTVQLALEAKRIQLELNLDPQAELVNGDPGRLQQVLWNLLSNAVKFTPEGGRVWVRLERVGGERGSRGAGEQGNCESAETINCPSSSHPPTSSMRSNSKESIYPAIPAFSQCAQITITDTGRGISSQFLPHLFEYFRQEDGSTTRQFGGLGLGLAIARQIVELHGGTISAYSAGEGQGATFTVRLPLVRSGEEAGKPGSGRAGESSDSSPIPPSTHLSTHPLAGLQILVVDDDPDTRELLNFLLETNGARVTTANSAIEALRSLKRNAPDLLLSDIGMPDQDGYGLMRSIRAAYPDRAIPAIALTAYAADYDRQKALQVGFRQHISKPINPDTLLQSILELVHPTPPPNP
ncbi:PAS domain-containing hybrid sensor histidine kinase/response regulator [Leptolyngbya ohadii]|uniref:PAS domain-containing hybrid sensor histidine kinase/response regulator n=1 Tax=Leptolyngbya ohadii TaxID=1962290 RepID=UPI0015C58A91|nr:PAS domain-containing protein [Leptolyngbya ohadii]